VVPTRDTSVRADLALLPLPAASTSSTPALPDLVPPVASAPATSLPGTGKKKPLTETGRGTFVADEFE
jgi:hypothetical protein